ncbi:DUF3152 domain-containing protein [Streptomyces sp. NPDC002138]|uniref:DUF3152 domain-containing protein n=1 Tax=Streptomyces sp. NPDC002138 TaxID=3154410 RepID=UPI00331C6599
MGRHSRKDSAPPRPVHTDPGGPDQPSGHPEAAGAGVPAGTGRRHRTEPTASHEGYVNQPAPGARAGHPELHEPGGAYGDWRAAPRSHPAPAPGHAAAPASGYAGAPASGYAPGHAPAPAPASAAYQEAVATAAAVFPDAAPAPAAGTGTPAAGFPQVTLPSPRTGTAHPAQTASVTSTGSHRRVPPPRRGARSTPGERPPVRSKKVRTYTGVAAAAVTTVLAVVVAGQVTSDDGSGHLGVQSAGDTGLDRAAPGQSAASRSDGRATPDAPALGAGQPALAKTYEQKLAEVYPIAANLKGPGTFDTVTTGAPAPGKGRLVRYRVDVEQGLGLDPDLFAEAVQRTLNDPRSWGHDGAMTFERVASGGQADFVITLASPGTTGVWCEKSGLDTTQDNVSCDSASTERVMINAFRWAQGSPTYGQDQMTAYRQMLINHEVGHRLGHDHVSCRTPGALAPIMQQQTKSLDIDGISCKPNPWVFPTG